MTNEEKRKALTSLLRELPDVLVPMQIASSLHQSKNLIYEKLKIGDLPYYPVNGKYLIAKADLIDYIIEHGDECVTADSESEAAMAENNTILSADSEYITLDATRRILHISKRKCAALLQNGTIPCTVSGKKTRQYRILCEDVIALMKSPGEEKPKNPIGRVIPCIYTTVPEGFRERLDDYWSGVSDVLTQADLITITGYSQSAVSGWMMSEKLKTVTAHGTPVTSREWLIDFMCGEGMMIKRKSTKHLELLDSLIDLS